MRVRGERDEWMRDRVESGESVREQRYNVREIW